MAGLSRSKNGVASLAYVPAIHVFASKKDVDARIRGHDGGKSYTTFSAPTPRQSIS